MFRSDHATGSAGLQALLCAGSGPAAAQTACFALSCLAAEEAGHALVLVSSAFPPPAGRPVLLPAGGRPDGAWFAAVAVGALVSQPSGVVRVRQHGLLEDWLRALCSSSSLGWELQEEVSSCLRKLQRLPKPLPPATKRLTSGSYVVSWVECIPESGLEVRYSLLDEDRLLYRGTQCHVTLSLSALQSQSTLSLRVIHSTADNDISPSSEPAPLLVEREGAELRPGQPQQLCVMGYDHKAWGYRGWPHPRLPVPPWGTCGGAWGCGGAKHLGGGTHLRRLMVTVLGRHELWVSLAAPSLPLGRLFNYELWLNSRVTYLGPERAHTARQHRLHLHGGRPHFRRALSEPAGHQEDSLPWILAHPGQTISPK
ncbi:uncharacterized protein LOC125746139 [Brienomyrus brachyistius]|uniref:uncharacterized protein LOC125746139 n=1 Tax=Brienomyrus brachyistius TaxID=42636 RepID=UPI0020B40BCB|nr:uncharacterized protein LOC125746139 [Brienomyrus brachyistius]